MAAGSTSGTEGAMAGGSTLGMEGRDEMTCLLGDI